MYYQVKGERTMYTIMLVEDDVQLSASIRECLERYTYKVVEPVNFMNIVEEFSMVQPDLVLLDINLPYFDGYYLCQAIRQKSTVPIIMISARTEHLEQMRAVELGADDYITKPFTVDHLLMKVRAKMRRVYGEYAEKERAFLKVGELVLHTDAMQLSYRNESIPLSKNEHNLLKKLMLHADEVVTREALIEEVWDDHVFIEDNTLTVNMSKVKRILQTFQIEGALQSRRGVGYILHSGKLI